MGNRLEGGQGLPELGRLVQGTQAPATDLDLVLIAILNQSLFVDVGLKARLGVPVGVANVVAAHARL